MCGIFALFNTSKITKQIDINNEFQKGVGRGPEHSDLSTNQDLNYTLGFHRLAINGLNSVSNQPFNIDGYTLICNGEIYNYKDLYRMMDIEPKTQSDCEVIIYLVDKYGIEQALRMLDGVFAFVLINNNTNEALVARDPYGVRPLYYYTDNSIGFSSELKMIHNFSSKVKQFTPGNYLKLYMRSNNWQQSGLLIKYHIPAFSYTDSYSFNDSRINKIVNNSNTLYHYRFEVETKDYIDYITDYDHYLYGIRKHLYNAVKKRVLATERPIACLLSGGLDSSLIAALVSEVSKELGNSKPIETYSIGLPGSTDLVYAKQVADRIQSKHCEILVTEEEMLAAIPEVIKAIESYDTTTVRASIGNYLLGKYIAANSEAKVIFNGDGADELAGGYLYMGSCPDSIEYDKETRRLLKDIHLFDVLRSDKCISSHGLEPRTPFLDKGFVNYYLSIPLKFRNHNNISFNNNPPCVMKEKYLIRNAFLKYMVLPNEIILRKKEAFSDGVSSHGKSLYQIIQEYVSNLPEYINRNDLTIKEKEKAYYKDLFLSYYPDCADILPYYWMPKYIQSDDPSARTLLTYTK